MIMLFAFFKNIFQPGLNGRNMMNVLFLVALELNQDQGFALMDLAVLAWILTLECVQLILVQVFLIKEMKKMLA